MTPGEARLLEDVGGDTLPGRCRRAAVRAYLGMDAEEGQRDTRRVCDDPSCRAFHGAPPGSETRPAARAVADVARRLGQPSGSPVFVGVVRVGLEVLDRLLIERAVRVQDRV